MMTMNNLERKLQNADKKHAALYLFCNFMALMLISSYSIMLLSPTILNVFPEGGDSRKQMIAIFVMCLFGCLVFTLYSAGLFFRKKSKQLGILMALGASKKTLSSRLLKEVLFLSFTSSIAGITASIPFVWLIWNFFDSFIASSDEMHLKINPNFLIISLLFMLMVVLFSCITALSYLRKTNIIDVIHEEHKNEPIHELGKWCGPLGFFLIVFGGILGYCGPSIYMNKLNSYPPIWLNILFVPTFIGLYLVMLHTVIHGWRSHKKNPYKNIISRSMMKFQGKQTVNNLLVITVLIAGACFAIFYIPLMASGQFIAEKNRAYDYSFNYPLSQSLPNKNDIEKQAADYNLQIKDWKSYNYLTLALDGEQQIEDGNKQFHHEYNQLLCQGKFLSEDTYNDLTNENIHIKPGTYCAITNKDETGTFWLELDSTKLTNMSSRKSISTKFDHFLHFDMLADTVGYYVLSNSDYNEISTSLESNWKGNLVLFNIKGEDNYEFADKLLHRIIESYDEEGLFSGFYDPIEKISAHEKGKTFWADNDSEKDAICNQSIDNFEFRSNWDYMPNFKIIESNNMLKTYSVFLMMFLFIFIVCMMSQLIISYTRCQTIALNNRYIFDDLRRLGASPSFLLKELKSQCGKIFKIPASVGIGSMYFLYSLILFGNDGKLTSEEILGLVICGVVLIFIGLIQYSVYKKTINIIRKQLQIA